MFLRNQSMVSIGTPFFCVTFRKSDLEKWTRWFLNGWFTPIYPNFDDRINIDRYLNWHNIFNGRSVQNQDAGMMLGPGFVSPWRSCIPRCNSGREGVAPKSPEFSNNGLQFLIVFCGEFTMWGRHSWEPLTGVPSNFETGRYYMNTTTLIWTPPLLPLLLLSWAK